MLFPTQETLILGSSFGFRRASAGARTASRASRVRAYFLYHIIGRGFEDNELDEEGEGGDDAQDGEGRAEVAAVLQNWQRIGILFVSNIP